MNIYQINIHFVGVLTQKNGCHCQHCHHTRGRSLYYEPPRKVPDDDARSDRYIHGVLSAKLGNLQASVAPINNLLMNAFDFVSQNNSILSPNNRLEMLKKRGAMSLLYRIHLIALALERLNCLQRRWEITPTDAVLGSQGRLVNLCHRRRRGDAAQTDTLDTKGIASTKHAANVVHRAHIVEHHHQRQLLRLTELFHREALHLYRAELLQ